MATTQPIPSIPAKAAPAPHHEHLPLTQGSDHVPTAPLKGPSVQEHGWVGAALEGWGSPAWGQGCQWCPSHLCRAQAKIKFGLQWQYHVTEGPLRTCPSSRWHCPRGEVRNQTPPLAPAQEQAGFRQVEGQTLQCSRADKAPDLLLVWNDYTQVIGCFCQLCPSMYLQHPSPRISSHGDTLAPLLPAPAAEAQQEMTTLRPFPTVPTQQHLISTLWAWADRLL